MFSVTGCDGTGCKISAAFGRVDDVISKSRFDFNGQCRVLGVAGTAINKARIIAEGGSRGDWCRRLL